MMKYRLPNQKTWIGDDGVGTMQQPQLIGDEVQTTEGDGGATRNQVVNIVVEETYLIYLDGFVRDDPLLDVLIVSF